MPTISHSLRLAAVAASIALAGFALAGCSSPTGGVAAPGAGPSCPALNVPTAADEKKTVKWPSTKSSKLADKLAVSDVLKGSCLYDLADAPKEAGVGQDSEGVLFVQINPSAASVKSYIADSVKTLKAKKFTVQTQDNGYSGSADTDKDGTDDVAIQASYEKKITADEITGDGGTFYKIFGLKAGNSVLFGTLGNF